MEFIISEHIGVHPMALIHPEKVTAPDRERINALAVTSTRRASFLSARWPRASHDRRRILPEAGDHSAFGLQDQRIRPVARGCGIRTERGESDAGLPRRVTLCHPAYADGFALECAALRRVREEMGLTNLRVMVPFCRRVTEAERVLQVMAQHGLNAAGTVSRST